MKKTLRIFIIIFVFLFVIFIIRSNTKLNGTWIGIYEYTDDEHSSIKFKNESTLLFKNFSIKKEIPLGNGISLPKSKCFILGQNILIKSSEFELAKINYINKDSLVLKKEGFVSLYRKLPDSLKSESEFDFKEKFYQRITDKKTDTIYFSNTYFVRNSLNPKRKWDTANWEIKQKDGFQVLFTGYSSFYVLKSKKEKTFLYEFSKDKIYKDELIKIEGNATRINKYLETII